MAIPTYVKNVAKSFGYAIKDTIKDYNPVVDSLLSDTKDTASDLYMSIGSFKDDMLSGSEKTLREEIKDSARDIWQNFKDDVSSGNLYQRDKKDPLADIAMKAAGLDMGDFDFDMEDWGDDEWTADDSQRAETETSVKNTKATIVAMDVASERIIKGVTKVQAQSTDYLAHVTRSGNKAMYDLNKRGFNNVSKALLNVNKSINAIAQLGKPLTEHMQNTVTFYTKTTESLEAIKNSLANIEKNTVSPLSSDRKTGNRRMNFSDIFSEDEGISISSYVDMVKQNFGDNKWLADALINGVKNLKNARSGGSFGKNISVTTMAMQYITKAMIPQALVQAMKGFNASLADFTGAGFIKLRDKKSDSIIVELLKDALFPGNTVKKFGTDKYEKGRVSWDGISRKALIETIPGYLRMIYNAISGDDKVYDYDRGQFRSAKSVKDDLRKLKTDEITSWNHGDFRDATVKKLTAGGMSKDEATKMVNLYLENAMFGNEKQRSEYYNFKDKNLASTMGVSQSVIEAMMSVFSDPKNRRMLNKMMTNVERSRNNYNDKITGLAESGDSVLTNLFNNGEGRGITFSAFASLTKSVIQVIPGYLAQLLANQQYQLGAMGFNKGVYKYYNYHTGQWTKSFTNSMKTMNAMAGGTSAGFTGTMANGRENSTKGSTGGNNNKSSDDSSDEGGPDPEKTQEELDRINEENMKAAKSELANTKFGKAFRAGLDKMHSIFRSTKDVPGIVGSVSRMINSITYSMDTMFFGKNDDDPNSIASVFRTEIKNIFEPLREFYDKHLKQYFDKFAKWLNEKFPGLGLVKEKLKGAKTAVGNWMSDTFLGTDKSGKKLKAKRAAYVSMLMEEGYTKAAAEVEAMSVYPDPNEEDIDQYAKGGTIRKTGLAVLSKGEFVIPSEYNPYYNGPTNKAAQINAERNVEKRYFGRYATGGRPGIVGKGVDLFGEGLGQLFNFFSGFFGGKESDKAKKDEKALSSKIKKLTDAAFKNEDVKDNIAAMAAGGLIGGGVSLLTGAVVGPLFGAAIGAGTGLLLNSKKVQEVLFGKDVVGPDGKISHEDGILPAKVSQFMKTQLPDIAKGAGVGAAAGIFFGSPVVGAILGGAVGFAKNSKAVQEFLFGKPTDKVDEDGNPIYDEGIIPRKLQEKFKKGLPRAVVGAGIGLVAGPFGVAGNVILGAGIGFLTTSEKFHDIMVGKDGDEKSREKSVIGQFKSKIVDNFGNLMINTGYAIKGFLQRTVIDLGDKIKKFFNNLYENAKNGKGGAGLLGKLFSGILGLGGGVLKGAINLPGAALAGLAKHRRYRNIKKGYNVYSKKLKRNLRAFERNEQRKSFGALYPTDEFDNYLANIKSKDDLNALQAALDTGLDTFTDSNENTIDLSKFSRGKRRNMMDLVKTEIDQFDAEGISLRENIQFHNKLYDTLQVGFNWVKEIRDKLFGKDEDGEKKEEEYHQTTLDEYMDSLNTPDEITDAAKDDIYQDKNGRWRHKNGRFAKAPTSEKEEDKKEESKEEYHQTTLDEAFAAINPTAAALLKGEGEYHQTTLDEAFSEIFNRANPEPKEGDTRSVPTQFGDKDQVFHHGEWINQNDNETKETVRKQNSFLNFIGGLPLIGSGIKKIGGFLSGIKEGLLGDGKEKKGILGTIKECLFGKDGNGGFIGGIYSFFTGGKGLASVGSVISKFASTAKMVAINAGVFAALGILLSDKFSDLIHNLIPNFGRSNNTTTTAQTTDGRLVTKDENGNWVDEDGLTVSINDIVASTVSNNRSDAYSFQERMVGNFARGTLTGTGSLAGSLLSKTTMGRAIASTAVPEGANIVFSLFKKIANGLKNSPILSKIISPDKIDDMFFNQNTGLYAKVVDKLGASGLKSVTNAASTALIVLKVALIVSDFTTGYEDARNTLGIFQEPTVAQRVISGLLRVCKNLIPFVGTLIPDSLVIDVFCNHIAPIFGISSSELMRQREESQLILEQYNAAHGTDLTTEQFIKDVMHDYTWTERAGNAMRSTWEETKMGTAQLFSDIREYGVMGTITNRVTDLENTFTEAYAAEGKGLAGGFAGLSASLEKALPGIFGDVAARKADIWKFAAAGKPVDMWKVTLKAMEAGGEDIEGTDLQTVGPGIFSRIIGQIPLVFTKVIASPLAMASWSFHSLLDKLGLDDEFRKMTGDVSDVILEAFSATKDGDINGLLHLTKHVNKREDRETPIGPIGRVVSRLATFTLIPIALVSKAGHVIADSVGPTIKKVSKVAKDTFTVVGRLWDATKEGDIDQLNATANEFREDPNNIYSPYQKTLAGTGQMLLTPIALAVKGGHIISEKVGAVTSQIKEDTRGLSDSFETMDELSGKGSIRSIIKIWSDDTKYDPSDGPLKYFYRAVNGFGRIFFTMKGVLGFFGNKMKGLINDLRDKYEWLDKLLTKLEDEDEDFKETLNESDTDTGLFGHLVSLTGGVNNDVTNAALNTFFGFGSGLAGSASGFVSQIDPRYRKLSVGGQSIFDNGCAPAVASMVASAYGKTYTMNRASGEANFYQSGGSGTTLDYFADSLGSRGINVGAIGNSAGVYNSLSQGRPVVLLGQDTGNGSKSNSPFGPNNHYVMASGLDRRGNIIVNDPEAHAPRSYSPNILRGVKAALGTSGRGSRPRRYSASGSRLSSLARKQFRRFRGGASEDQRATIYAYFKSKGMRDFGIAGLMGCWQHESGNKPNRVEGDYLRSYPGYDNVMSSNQAMDNYVLNVLFPAYDASNVAINKDAYKMSDGHYYPGLGLAQWTKGRTYNLLQFAKSKGWDWRTLEAQLEYAWYELNSSYSGCLAKLNAANSVDEATQVAYTHYEGCGTNYTTDKFLKRLQSAYEIYNAYSGSTATFNGFTGSDSGTSSSFLSTASNFISNGISNIKDYLSSRSSSGGVKGGALGALKGFFSSIFTGALNGNMADSVGSFFNGTSNSSGGFLNNLVSGATNAWNNFTSGSTSSSSTATPGTAQYSGVGSNGVTSINNFPYFNQNDEPWKNVMYSYNNDPTATIQTSGCGPTSGAMILKSYGINTNPIEMADYAFKNGFRPYGGTSGGFFPSVGNAYGLDVQNFQSTDTAKQMLMNNIPLVALMKKGDFTGGGHYVVISGYDPATNTFTVNDSNSRPRSEQKWDWSKMGANATNFWSFSKDGQGSIGTYGTKSAFDSFGNRLSNWRNNNLSGGSSGLYNTRPGSALRKWKRTNGRHISGGASGLSTTPAHVPNIDAIVKRATSQSSNGALSPSVIYELLAAIAQILMAIAGNTGNSAQIAEMLAVYLPKLEAATGLSKEQLQSGIAQARLNSEVVKKTVEKDYPKNPNLNDVDKATRSIKGSLEWIASN